MLYSKLFGKTTKTYPKDEVSINAKFLLQAGFIDKLMAGSYTLLPLGRLVQRKIEQIVREEMNKIGSQEVLMPLLHPKNIWNETGRWEKAKEVMYQFKKDDKEYALSFTHEEIVLDLVRKHSFSHKDYPIKIYHFSTKFRDEPRAKSGILRGREFIMKDLYSVHTSEKELDEFYWLVAEAYKKTYKRLGMNARIVESGGGVFTESNTHEFQVFSEVGEDTVYYCDSCDFAENAEIAMVKEGDKCPKCKEVVKVTKAIEMGNIFKFGTSYSEMMNVSVIDEKGEKQLAHFGSYGIGITRAIGVLVETSHDERGIIWPESVAPYKIHLVGLDLQDESVKSKAENLYKKLDEQWPDQVLFDEREEVRAGEKFADADLIGIPHRLVISKKSGDQIEYKARNKKDSEMISFEDLRKKVS